MSHFIKTIIVAGALAFAGHQAQAEKFYTTLSAVEYFPDSTKGNKIVRVTESNALLISDAAADFSLDAKTLAVVFDTVTNQIQIVKKTDGSVVDVEFEIRGGNTITSPEGTLQYRQAFLYKFGATTPYGSAIGRIDRKFDVANPTVLVKFVWSATFQHSVPATAADEPSEIVTGRFVTGKLFVPKP